MEEVNRNVKTETARVTRNTAMIALIELVTTTPVDTSTAVSNWQVAVSTQVVSEINAYFAGRQGSTAPASISAAIALARAEVETYRVASNQGFITISNLLDYIERLNAGSSLQEPAGLVERAMQKATRYVRTAHIKL